MILGPYVLPYNVTSVTIIKGNSTQETKPKIQRDHDLKTKQLSTKHPREKKKIMQDLNCSASVSSKFSCLLVALVIM